MRAFCFILCVSSFFLSRSQENDMYIYIKNTNLENREIKQIEKIKIEKIEERMEKFIVYYENNGYPFAQIRLENIDGNKADLIVNKGNKYTIDSFAVYGNASISSTQLYQLVGIKKGSTYNQDRIDNINNAIQQISYLSQSKQYELIFHKNTVDIYFYLQKEKSNLIDGIIGLNNNDEKIQLNGFAKIKLQNIINKLETINIIWSGDQAKFQKLESNINIPYLMNSKIGSYLQLDIYQQKLEFTNILTETRIIYPMSTTFMMSINYQKKNSITEDDSFTNVRQDNIGIGCRYEKLMFIHLNAYYGKRKLQSNKKDSYSLSMTTNNKIRIKEKIIIDLSTNSSILYSEDIHLNELLFFGGSNSLKGFNDNQFLSNQYSIVTANFSYHLEENTSSSLFYQQAYFRKEAIDENAIYGWPRSVGAGLDINSKSGILYIQYAIGIYKDQTFNLQNGRVHLGIQNTF